MTNLNEQDLLNVCGGITRMTQDDPNGPGYSASYKPEDEQTSDAK